MSLSSKVIRNSLTAVLSRLWNAGATMVVMPIMLYILKQDAVGIWFLSNSLLLIFALADIGVAPALSKYIPEHLTHGDDEALNRDVNTGIVFYLSLAIACIVLGVAFGDVYLRFIRTPDRLMPEAHVMFLWVATTIAVIVFTNAWRSMLIGMHRMDLINTVEVIISVPWLIGMILALKLGYGLPGIAVVQFGQYTAMLVILAVLALRNLPGFHLRPALSNRVSFKRLAGFGVQATAASMASTVYMQAEQLIITRLLGPGVLGLYQFGFKIVSLFYTAIQPVFYAIVPAASEINAVEDSDRVRALYIRGTKFLLAIVVPGGTLLAITAPLTITMWLGAGYGISILTLRLLAISAVLTVGVGVAKSVARGVGRLGPELVTGGVFLLAFFGLVFPLGYAFGLHGIMAADIAAAFIAALVLLFLLYRAMSWRISKDLWRVYITPAVIALVVGVPIYWFNHLRRAEIMEMGRLSSRVLRLAPFAVAEAVIFVVAVGILFWITRYITPGELQSLRSAVKGMRGAHSTPDARPQSAVTEA